jgi:hypothetical protein
MRIPGVWASRETDGFVAGGEVDVKPCDERMKEIIAFAVEGERCREGQVGGRAGIEVEG